LPTEEAADEDPVAPDVELVEAWEVVEPVAGLVGSPPLAGETLALELTTLTLPPPAASVILVKATGA